MNFTILIINPLYVQIFAAIFNEQSKSYTICRLFFFIFSYACINLRLLCRNEPGSELCNTRPHHNRFLADSRSSVHTSLAGIPYFQRISLFQNQCFQVVYAREIRQWVQSGLWLSCQTRFSFQIFLFYFSSIFFSDQMGCTAVLTHFHMTISIHTSVMKFPVFEHRLSIVSFITKHNFKNQNGKIIAWQRTLFHIYLISQAFAMLSLISFCVSVSHKESKMPNILRSVFLVLAG